MGGESDILNVDLSLLVRVWGSGTRSIRVWDLAENWAIRVWD